MYIVEVACIQIHINVHVCAKSTRNPAIHMYLRMSCMFNAKTISFSSRPLPLASSVPSPSHPHFTFSLPPHSPLIPPPSLPPHPSALPLDLMQLVQQRAGLVYMVVNNGYRIHSIRCCSRLVATLEY